MTNDEFLIPIGAPKRMRLSQNLLTSPQKGGCLRGWLLYARRVRGVRIDGRSVSAANGATQTYRVMKRGKFGRLKPSALIAVGVVLGRGAQADTIITFNGGGANNTAITAP